MGFFSSIGKAIVNTATLPLSATKDLLTGEVIEERNATTRNLDRIANNLRKANEKLDDR